MAYGVELPQMNNFLNGNFGLPELNYGNNFSMHDDMKKRMEEQLKMAGLGGQEDMPATDALMNTLATPPRNPDEQELLKREWRGWGDALRNNPELLQSIAILGNAIASPGELGANLSQAALSISQLQANAKKLRDDKARRDRQDTIQELGIASQIEKDKRGEKRADRAEAFNIMQYLESRGDKEFNHRNALMQLGFEERRLAVSESAAKSNAQTDILQRKLLTRQIEQKEKEMLNLGVNNFEVNSNTPIGDRLIMSLASDYKQKHPEVTDAEAIRYGLTGFAEFQPLLQNKGSNNGKQGMDLVKLITNTAGDIVANNFGKVPLDEAMALSKDQIMKLMGEVGGMTTPAPVASGAGPTAQTPTTSQTYEVGSTFTSNGEQYKVISKKPLPDGKFEYVIEDSKGNRRTGIRG